MKTAIAILMILSLEPTLCIIENKSLFTNLKKLWTLKNDRAHNIPSNYILQRKALSLFLHPNLTKD